MKLVAAVLALAVPAASAQDVLFDLPYGVPSGTWRFSNVRGLSDLDGDGTLDFAIGTRVFSGADAGLIFDAAPLLGFDDPVSVDEMGDLDGDGVQDLVFGDLTSDFDGPPPMAVVSGADGSLLGKASPFGWYFGFDTLYFVAGGGDLDGDGIGDALFSGWARSLLEDGFFGYVSGASLAPQLVVAPTATLAEDSPTDGAFLGDLNGDGTPEVAYQRGVYSSRIDVISDLDDYLLQSGAPLLSGLTGIARFARVGDYDGDGFVDLVCSFFSSVGGMPVYQPKIASGLDLGLLFEPDLETGQSVAGVGDVDCDGRPDFLTSVDDNSPVMPPTQLLSGSDASPLWTTTEVVRSMAALGDINGDGVADWIVGFDTHTQVWTGPGPTVTTYCTGKITSAGCTPTIDTGGFPTASGPDDFAISTRKSLADKPGLFFWGTNGRLAVPFLGGTLCVAPSLQRGPVLVSQGPADCLGGYAFLFAQTYADSFGLVGGETVNGQFWMRDPAHPDGTGVTLSDAVEFAWCP